MNIVNFHTSSKLITIRRTGRRILTIFKSIKIPMIPMDPDIRENSSSMIDVTEAGRSGRLIQPKTILMSPEISFQSDFRTH